MSKKLIDMKGQRFGRLVVLSRDINCPKKETKWNCLCDCGEKRSVNRQNLIHGKAKSCGCLARELSAARRRAAKKPPKKCLIDGCKDTTEKGAKGLCGKHSQRVRRYGDPNYITPESERRLRLRAAQPNLGRVKRNTYKKLLGRHEHRVVAERMIGRTLERGEVVHHKDRDRHNNSPDNLQVMDRAEHLRLHAAERW